MENLEQHDSHDGATAGHPDSPRGWRLIFQRSDGLRSGWRLLLFAIFFFVALQLLLNAAIRLRLPLPTSRSVIAPATAITQEGVSILATFAAVLLMAWIERRSFSDYGLPLRAAFRGRFWQGSIWGIAAFSATILLIAALKGFSLGHVALSGRALVQQSLLWALVFVLVGIWEESFFRGYALFTLADGIGFWPAACVLSAFFGFTHLSNGGEGWSGVPQIFLISILFCLTLRRTGNLWFAVGMHAGWDYAETFLFSAPDSGTVAPGTLLHSSFHGPRWLTGGAVGPEASVFSLLVLLVAMLLFARLYPPREEADRTTP
ncbi:MAG: lysostaphin resistance A-like protein [Candidatus Acidiferrales bacterium]